MAEAIFSIGTAHPPKPYRTISTDARLGTAAAVHFFSLGAGTDISPERYDRPAIYLGAAGTGVFFTEGVKEAGGGAETTAAGARGTAVCAHGADTGGGSAVTRTEFSLEAGSLLYVPAGTLCGVRAGALGEEQPGAFGSVRTKRNENDLSEQNRRQSEPCAGGVVYTEILLEKEESNGEAAACDAHTDRGADTAETRTRRVGKGKTMNDILKAGEVFKLKDMIAYEKGSISNMDLVSTEKVKFMILSFDEGCALEEHRAPGNALVFALEGKATIGYEGGQYAISEGENFRFAKNALHSVTAQGRFKMALLLVKE